MTTLFDELDESQIVLLNLVMGQFVGSDAQFPVYNWVEHQMYKRGFDAAEALRGLPTIFPAGRAGSYGIVYMDTPNPIPATRIHLTMAGLYHLGGDDSARIINGVLTWVQAMDAAKQRAGDHPFHVPPIAVDVRDVFKDRPEEIPWASAIAEREWPAIGTTRTNGTLMGELRLVGANFSLIEDYLAAVVSLATPLEAAKLVYSDQRALTRAISNFERACELALGKRLVPRPAIDRGVLLGTAVTSHGDLQSGLSALGEVLSGLDVPGKRPSHALGRLYDHLVDRLPAINQTVARETIDRLDAAREIRNTGQHDKAKPQLVAAHDLLGLPFPIRNPAQAWDTIRAHMEWAFNTLGDEIYAARPTIDQQPEEADQVDVVVAAL